MEVDSTPSEEFSPERSSKERKSESWEPTTNKEDKKTSMRRTSKESSS